MKIDHAAILAGGLGKRLGKITKKTPKPLIKINNIEKELHSKPLSVEQLKAMDNILNGVTNLSSEISPLLREESIVHEFKASLRTPFPSYPEPYVDEKGQQQYKLGKEVFKSKKEIHIFLQFQVLKAIASFLNTRGGTLVIGVNEYGGKKEVVGIEREGFESVDHYIRHLIGLLKNMIILIVMFI